MNEVSAAKVLLPSSSSSASSSLAVVSERKPPPQHSPGGCVGIFFKLFDWNRRFAKKKLFPKKLLPPAGATQVSKKFNADEKLPTARHLLIADAKTGGGSTSMKKKNVIFRVEEDSERKRGEDDDTRMKKTTPGVVARLMGLDTLPAAALQQNPPPKPFCKGGGTSSSPESGIRRFANNNRPAKEEEDDLLLLLQPDKTNNNITSSSRHEFQAQKIQKTGMCERRPLNRLNRLGGAVEAFQIRNVLSRSRKRQPKLASPVKKSPSPSPSPKPPPAARNSTSSRLMDAAARIILEPGLQQAAAARNRAECALTYPNPPPPSIDHPSLEDDMVDLRLPPETDNSCREMGINPHAHAHAHGHHHHSSCRNCGHLLDSMGLLLASDHATDPDPTPVFDSSHRTVSNHQHDRMVPYQGKESEVVLLRSRSSSSSSLPVHPNKQNHWRLPLDSCSSSSSTMGHTEPSSSFSGLNSSSNRAQPVLLRDDRVPPPRSVLANSSSSGRRRVSSSNSTNSSGKDLVTQNRNVRCERQSHSRARGAFRKTDDELLFDSQTRRDPVARNEFSSSSTPSSPRRDLVRKRNAPAAAAAAGSRRVVDCSVSSSTMMMDSGQRSIKSSRVTASGNGPRFGTSSCSSSSSRPNHAIKGKSGCHGGDDRVSSSSAMKSSSKAARAFSSEGRVGGKSSSTENVRSNSPSLQIDGGDDALGILLQQKLKELTCQAENESANGEMMSPPQGRTTATILQELISALTVDQLQRVSQDEVSAAAQIISADHAAAPPGSEDKYCQANDVDAGRTRQGSNNDHFSPGSVLDAASFSNDSCSDGPGQHLLQSESMDLSYEDDPGESISDADADISDSASSIINRGEPTTCRNNNNNNNNNTSTTVVVADLHICSALQRLTSSFSNAKSAAATCYHYHEAKDILLHMELIFGGSGGDSQSEYIVDFLLGSFLDQLETLALAAWRGSVILGFDKKGDDDNSSSSSSSSSVRSFLFDSLVECLELRYGRYSNSGYRTWRDKIPYRMMMVNAADVLLRVFDDEVRKWAGLAGRTPDEIIDWEMGHSLGKWTCFEIEEFEAGVQIGQEIVQGLVDEIVADLMMIIM